MRQNASERDATMHLAPQPVMQLACVTCREMLTIAASTCGSPCYDHVAQSGESSGAEGDVDPRIGDTSSLLASCDDAECATKISRNDSAILSHDEMARCSACDGWFHILCLEKQRQQQEKTPDKTATRDVPPPTARFMCAQCSSSSSSSSGGPPDATAPALLVPVGALPYLAAESTANRDASQPATLPTGSHARRSSNANSDGSVTDEWFIFTKRVEVCTRCRQVDIDASDRVMCGSCSVAQVHARCCAFLAVASDASAQQSATARKRKRPPLARPVCQHCALALSPSAGDTSVGVIAPRSISMLAQRSPDTVALCGDGDGDGSVEWSRQCRQCTRRFCVTEFSDVEAGDSRADAAGARTGASADWTCIHCATHAATSPEPLVSSSVKHAASSGSGVADATVGCDCQLQQADAAGTSLCAACAGVDAVRFGTNALALASADTNALAAPQELVTLLICDGCEGEFDFAQLVPPLAEIPSGDWFCAACAPTTSSTATASDATASAAVGVDPTVAALSGDAPLVDVTLLICDDCDGEFDMGALVPPLTHVPAGDWFCAACAASRAKSKSRVRSKSRSERRVKRPVKAPVRALVPPLLSAIAVVSQPMLEPTAAPDELVTMLICDGCEGEFDAALLQPPLTEIPSGDWFCAACEAIRAAPSTSSAASRRRSSKTATTVLASVSETLLPAAESEHVDVSAIVTEGVESTTTSGRTSTSTTGSSSKKRKRSGLGYQAKRRGKATKLSLSDGAPGGAPSTAASEHVEMDASVAGIHIPHPVVAPSRTATDDRGSKINGAAIPLLQLSDDDASDHDDTAEDAFVVVCDLCHADFTLLDPATGGGGVDAAAAQLALRPQPWYCGACVKSLKRTRKKRQRFSKQLLLEMQVFGERLRPLAAAAYDITAAALRGKPPRTRHELATMFALVGKRVGVYLKWDKHWVVGRVVSFDAHRASFRHVVRFEDGVERALPLYALPLVVGTRTIVYVQVPTLQNQWWPAQVLRLNPMAKKLLTPSATDGGSDTSAAANFRLVSIFASSDSVGKTQNVSCWVPKYLCRSMAAFSPRTNSGSGDERPTGGGGNSAAQVGSDNLDQSIARALAEPQCEDQVLRVAFERLVRDVCVQDADRVLELGDALVGLELVEHSAGSTVDSDASQPAAAAVTASARRCAFTVAAFNADAKQLVLQRAISNDDEVRLELRNVAHRFFLRDSAAYAELAVQFVSHASGVDASSPAPRGVARASSDSLTAAATAPTEPMCALCLLPARTEVDENDAVAAAEDELVACTKCPRHFHRACCDPPHEAIPLLNDDDGSVMLDDVHAPYVCSACTACAGCLKRLDADADAGASACGAAAPSSPSWSQWRLPLQVATLCCDCVPFYEAKQFCAVCLRVLSDDALATCVAMHACSTCELWVHAACEPDPHPAFTACSRSAEFELDVHVELPPLPVVGADGDSDAPPERGAARTESDESTSVAAPAPVAFTATAEPEGESKPARLVEEALAFALRFKDAYDPKVLHKYECLTCRTCRVLRVLERLRAEDKLELFTEPVTKSIAPTYFDVIKEPMDLRTMQRRALARAYTRVNFRDVRDDFELLCLNAVTFNSKDRDFLIWREAWRFYGQGQRILRQAAPKSRMQHRGGKYHDALVLAAKRQLPNNSAIGKTQLYDAFDGGTGDDDLGAGAGSADGDNDDELDTIDDRVDAAAAVADDAGATLQATGSTSTGDSAVADGTGASATRDGEIRPVLSESGANVAALPGDAVAPLANGLSASGMGSALLAERKPQPAAATAIVLQSELGEPPLPQSAIPVFTMVQARLSAHTYAWLDMCLACGSAGLSSELVFCVDCGEGFHSFCAPDAHGGAFWRCANCKMCELCGRPGGDSAAHALHFCSACDCGFHGACVVPAIQPATDSDDDDDDVDGDNRVGDPSSASSHAAIYCASCVACRECGKTQPETAYSYDRHVCLSCSRTKQFEATLKAEKSKPLVQIWTADARKQRKDSEKCPLCKLRWDPNDEELIQCDACELWAHPTCDSLLTAEPERYRRLVDDPSAQYICEVCRPNERAHLAAVPGSSKCQALIGLIQDKRAQTHAKWREAREQLAQGKQWKYWRDHTPVYLYILRLGEECLKTLACRSVNFRANWTRWSRDVELAAAAPGVAVPEWLVHKASRYMRFKRYSRGPRAALRRQERKASSFYSRQGVEKQRDVSAIATIVSEACCCAALLACVHLFYGWRPLPQVVLHLLSSDAAREQRHEPLSSATLALLSQGAATAMTLEDEIVMIQTQYDRRVGKKPVARDASDTNDGPSGHVSNGASDRDGNVNNKGSPVKAPVTAVPASSDANASAPTTQPPVVSSVNSDAGNDASSAAEVASSSDAKQLVRMTRVPALCGWPSADAGETTAVVATPPSGEAAPGTLAIASAVPPTDARAKFVDNRFCAFCFMIGDDLICGRLIYTDKDQWVHVNCALWSVEVYETPDGVLQKCQKAKNRSRLLRCDACGVLGASVGCAVSRCQRHFHFPCAYDAGVVFLPNGETCCPKPEHIAVMTRKQKLVVAAPADESALALADESVPAAEDSVLEPPSSTPTDETTAGATTDAVEVSETVDGTHIDATAEQPGDSESATDVVQPGATTALTTESAAINGVEPEHEATVSAVNGVEMPTAERTVDADSSVLDGPAPVSGPNAEPSAVTTVADATAAPVLPVVDPAPEPRRHLRSDLPVPMSDLKKQGAKSRRPKRAPCLRLGALTVQSFGHIVVGNASFHSRDAIFPLGYRSTRIFWSARTRATRCLYECVVTSSEIEARANARGKHPRKRDAPDDDSTDRDPRRSPARAVFKIVASDDRAHPIVASTPDAAVLELRSRVAALYDHAQCFGTAERNPFIARTSWFSYGLAGTHFFGFGLPAVATELEQLPHAATTSIRRRLVAARIGQTKQPQRRATSGERHGTRTDGAAIDGIGVETRDEAYVFTQHLPTPQQFADALRQVEELVAAEERARLSTGSTRTDGLEWHATAPSEGTAPIRRRLNKHASRETPETASGASGAAGAVNGSGSASSAGAAGSSAASGSAASSNNNANASANANAKSSGGGGGVAMDLEHLPIAMQYRELRRRPFDERLEVRKSKIHGYGLFTKETIAEGQMIVEYQGQMIAQDVADERERQYEEQGIGSCYMFRLDDKTIIDATRVGNLARFINHSCDPKAFARVVTVEGNEKKIVIFAKRAIDAGDEVTYDYKFPIEDEAIRCDCSAPNCIGRMN